MNSLVRLWQRFVLGVSANWVAKLGAALTTGSFLLLILFQVLALTGALQNPYFDMVAFLTLPALMAGGLVLVAIGWIILVRGERARGGSVERLLAERFGKGELVPSAFGTRLFWTIALLSAINAIVLGGVSLQAKHFMDSREFCGTACHVMDPEWRAYQAGPHAGVDCVDCHVGEGMGALIESKIGGARQMWREMTNTYSRPIPTPVHQFRSTDETCARCHQRDADHGTSIVVHERFAHDAASTPTYSALRLRVGGGESPGVHWHARSDVEVRFGSLDGKREVIEWIEVLREDDSTARYENATRSASASRTKEARTSDETEARLMDCTDCHNRTGHPFQSPDDAIDAALSSGALDRQLPRIKDKAYGVVTGAVPAHGKGATPAERVTLALERHFASTHAATWHERRPQIEQAGGILAGIYEQNVFPEMRVRFGTYPDHSAHPARGSGCFRCHSSEIRDATGEPLAHECETCHEVLADEAPVLRLPLASTPPSYAVDSPHSK